MPRLRFAPALLLALLVLLSSDAAADTPYSELYVRNAHTPSKVLQVLDASSRRRGAEAILVVFDAASFSPPPHINEFDISYDFRPDLARWIEALRTFSQSASAPPVYLASTLSASPHLLGGPTWAPDLERDLTRRWWEEKGLREFEPAAAWMSRLLAKVPGKVRYLALITGEILPERLADHSRLSSGAPPPVEGWRRKLLDPGEYWDEEAVASRLRRLGVFLDVVAPQVPFGDCWPVQEIPELPWASRPKVPMVREKPSQALERMRRFREKLGLPEVGDDALREVLRRNRCRRFCSITPLWQTFCGSYLFFNTDCPSGYGYWPFVRAAAATGGSYVFYPFPEAEFLDECPYDPVLLARLAPETTSREEAWRAADRDEAIHALVTAARLVEPVTPWRDGPPRATGWAALKSAKPLARETSYRDRNKPYDFDKSVYASMDECERRGRDLRTALPVYDRAIELLTRVKRQIESGELPPPRRRSMAHLRLGIFWFEMSAFHLDALSLFLTEVRGGVPERDRKDLPGLSVSYVPAIRMSDCLPAYDGRRITRERDRSLQSEPVGWLGKGQGNLLPLEEDDPDYRALRHPAEVFKRLDPRLVPRAMRMIDAAHEVMRQEGRSPFGWMVYYSEAHTFVWYAVDPSVHPKSRPGEGDDPSGESTPKPRTQPKGPRSGG